MSMSILLKRLKFEARLLAPDYDDPTVKDALRQLARFERDEDLIRFLATDESYARSNPAVAKLAKLCLEKGKPRVDQIVARVDIDVRVPTLPEVTCCFVLRTCSFLRGPKFEF
jgi:hypothetical protein